MISLYVRATSEVLLIKNLYAEAVVTSLKELDHTSVCKFDGS